jgi:hypothetical protein
MNVPLSVPFSILGHHNKSLLLGLLKRHLASFDSTPRATLRARSANIFPLVFRLLPHSSTLGCCLTAAGLEPKQDSLQALSLIVAHKYVAYRSTIPPSIDQRGFKILSWNATSLPVRDPNHWKFAKLRRMLRDHIVCIQETRLSAAEMHALQMLFPQCLVLGSPAVATIKGSSGGLAVILPTHLYGSCSTWSDIRPGYAGVVNLQLRNAPLRILNVYLRPGHEKDILSAASKALKHCEPFLGTTICVGDANAIRTHKTFTHSYNGTSVS